MNSYISKNWVPFYVLWCVNLILGIGAYWAGYNGVYEIVYASDATHITQAIAAIAIIGMARLLWLSYRWDSTNSYIVTQTRKHLHEWNFMANILVIFGLIGTLIGFTMTFFVLVKAFSNTTITSSLILSILPNLIVPIGTVFLPTIFGLIGLAILTCQLTLFKSFSKIDDDLYKDE